MAQNQRKIPPAAIIILHKWSLKPTHQDIPAHLVINLALTLLQQLKQREECQQLPYSERWRRAWRHRSKSHQIWFLWTLDLELLGIFMNSRLDKTIQPGFWRDCHERKRVWTCSYIIWTFGTDNINLRFYLRRAAWKKILPVRVSNLQRPFVWQN